MNPHALPATAALAFPLALFALLIPAAHADFRAGAAQVDITPSVLPVLVNGGMLSRSVDQINTLLPKAVRPCALIERPKPCKPIELPVKVAKVRPVVAAFLKRSPQKFCDAELTGVRTPP